MFTGYPGMTFERSYQGSWYLLSEGSLNAKWFNDQNLLYYIVDHKRYHMFWRPCQNTWSIVTWLQNAWYMKTYVHKRLPKLTRDNCLSVQELALKSNNFTCHEYYRKYDEETPYVWFMKKPLNGGIPWFVVGYGRTILPGLAFVVLT